jgi:PAS domain S-box-containing protein
MFNIKAGRKSVSLGICLNFTLALVLSLAAVFLINQVNNQGREQALLEAEAKAQLILDRNLAIHTYFSHTLKPKVFELTDPVRDENYFEPAWMSSTYAVREIDKIFKTLNKEEYYYKECAINARSPENEADEFEKAFIEELNADPTIGYRSLTRQLDDGYYYVTLRRGEAMEESCLRCHTTPGKAPQGLVDVYGAQRSFNRSNKDVVSAISIRVPLSAAYARADLFSRHLATLFVIVLIMIFAVQHFIHKFLILEPIIRMKNKAMDISENEELLGEEISPPTSYEFGELAAAFNTMSRKLRLHVDHLEEMVKERTWKLNRSKEEWEATFNAIPDIITIQDRDMRIVRANREAELFFHRETEGLIGQSCYEVLRGVSEPCPGCPLPSTRSDKGTYSEIIYHAEMAKTFQVSSSAMLDEKGEVQYLVHIARDITEQKKQEQLLLQMSVQQEQLNHFESLRTMAGAIAHRFNNSMAAVLGNLELILDTLPDHSAEKEMATDAMLAGKEASLVGSMMLSYVGQRPLELQIASLSDLAGGCVTELQRQSPSSCTVKCIPPPAPLLCSMDIQQIKEVITSIIMNGIESLPDDSGEVEISFGSDYFQASSFPVVFHGNGAADGRYNFCQVRDRGEGIAPENLQRIFEPFFTTKFVGRGLGLALCVGIMRGHHGAVLVESGPSTGTTVRMLLPVVEPEQEDGEPPE